MADAVQPPDPQVAEQALRKGEIEIKKLEAETRTAEIASLSSKLPTEIPSGTLTVDDHTSPVGVVAVYRAVKLASVKIAATVPSGVTVRIVPTDVSTRERAMFGAITDILARLNNQLAQVQAMLTPPTGFLPFVPAMAAIGVAAQVIPMIASLMKTNVTAKSSDVAITFNSAAAAVAGELIAGGRTVLIDGAPLATGTAIADQVTDMQTARDALVVAASRLATGGVAPTAGAAAAAEMVSVYKSIIIERAKVSPAIDLSEELDKLREAAKAGSEFTVEAAHIVDRASLAAQILNNVDEALNALQTADEAGIRPVDLADRWLVTQGFHNLILVPAYGGARSVYEEVAGRKDREQHAGSAVLSYVLSQPNGTVVTAGSVFDGVAATGKMGETNLEWGAFNS